MQQSALGLSGYGNLAAAAAVVASSAPQTGTNKSWSVSTFAIYCDSAMHQPQILCNPPPYIEMIWCDASSVFLPRDHVSCSLLKPGYLHWFGYVIPVSSLPNESQLALCLHGDNHVKISLFLVTARTTALAGVFCEIATFGVYLLFNALFLTLS